MNKEIKRNISSSTCSLVIGFYFFKSFTHRMLYFISRRPLDRRLVPLHTPSLYADKERIIAKLMLSFSGTSVDYQK